MIMSCFVNILCAVLALHYFICTNQLVFIVFFLVFIIDI